MPVSLLKPTFLMFFHPLDLGTLGTCVDRGYPRTDRRLGREQVGDIVVSLQLGLFDGLFMFLFDSMFNVGFFLMVCLMFF